MDHMSMINQCLYGAHDRLNKWEEGFLESLVERLDDGRELTDQQVEKLTEIYEERV